MKAITIILRAILCYCIKENASKWKRSVLLIFKGKERMKILKILWRLFKETFISWQRDRGPLMGAAMAFYASLSLAPLFLIAVVIAGMVFGRQAAQGELATQLNGLLGNEGALVVERLIANLNRPTSDIFATTIGIIIILWCSTRIFWSLKNALNHIWKVPVKEDYLWLRTILDNFVAFSMVLATGFLLILSVILSTFMASLQKNLAIWFPRISDSLQVIHLIYTLIALLVTIFLFASIFRFLPDVKIGRSEIWIGAAVTSLLFSLGKFIMGSYLSQSFLTSTYGAVGSFIMVLLWVYYSAQIFLIGAEFTHILANRSTSGILTL